MSKKIEFLQPNAEGIVDVPDELMPLVNKFGMQLRLCLISGKNEALTAIHMAQIAKGYADEQSEIISDAVYEGAQQWEEEYKSCRRLLQELVDLKNIKDTIGKTEAYNTRQPQAWEDAKEFLLTYQHL